MPAVLPVSATVVDGVRSGRRVSLGVFVADVRPRWSDMDSFGHVNHASTVTLLEEARVELIFTEAARHDIDGFRRGVVVARLAVDYHRPLVVDGGSIRVEMAVRELRSASFSIDYKVRSGRAPTDAVAATASTRLVPYNRSSERPRRLTDAERDFLAGWLARSDGDDSRAGGAGSRCERPGW